MLRRCSSSSRRRVSAPRPCPPRRVRAACGYRLAVATRSTRLGAAGQRAARGVEGQVVSGVLGTVIALGCAALDVRHTRCAGAVARPRIRRDWCRRHQRCRDESTTQRHCSHELHGLSVCSRSAFASTISTVVRRGTTLMSHEMALGAVIAGACSVVRAGAACQTPTWWPTWSMCMCGRATTSPTPKPLSATATASATGSRRAALRAAGRRQGRLRHHRLLPGAYLINQAVNELCPAQIWQLRQSAAGYTLPADSHDNGGALGAPP